MSDAADNQEPNPLGVSDEDFGKLNTAFPEEPEAQEEQEQQEEEQEEEAGEGEQVAEAEGDPEGVDEGEGEPATDPDEEEEKEEEEKPEGEESEGDSEKEEESEKEETDDKDEKSEAQKFFEEVTAPFKANGQQMQIKSSDDVVRLMQMGANYNKKMAALKPSLKMMKMLDRNGLLDEDRLSFLIDLDKKDPTAIAKLIKDSDLDPMDLDLEQGKDYKSSKKYAVDDREIALDNVIEDLKDSPTYSKTIDLVSNRWDDNSRNIVANEPELMRVIDEHMQNGVYEVISTEVDKERTLGRLNGMTDIEAYRQTGDRINANGGFDHLFQKKQSQPETPKQETPAKKSDNSNDRKAKRNAARPSKAAPSTSNQPNFNPLGMSDEEFMKDADTRFG